MKEYKKAQRDSLELLQIIDDVCQKNNILYSLSGITLVGQHYMFEFDQMNPNHLSVCLLYTDYLRLIALLEKQKESLGILIVNYQNRSDFDTLSTWIFKKEVALLPKQRNEDELFYLTPFIITPVFYAGKTEHTYAMAEREIRKTFQLLNARAPLPHKRWFSSLSKKVKRLRGRIYRAQRLKKQPSIRELINRLTKYESDSTYLIFRNEGGRISKIFSHEFQVQRVLFMSINTYSFIESKKIIDRNYSDLITAPDKKVSDLLLRGGRDLRRIQLIQLDMLIEVDRICRKYHLKYNIAFGTLLGAVRHKGFIPWDDDADINMPYEDYQKLVQIIDTELDSEKYYFRIQEKEQDCNITYAHLKRNGTIYTKPGRDNFSYHPGVFIDIVPIFNGAPNFLLHSIQTRICWFFRTACWAYVGADSEKKFLKRKYYKLIARIGNKKSYNLFMKFATICKHKREKMLFLNGMDRSPYNIGFVKRKCYDEPVELEFEGHMFYAPAEYEQVLKYCYGEDYMMYPPLMRRQPKNNALIDLGDLYSNVGRST